MNLKVKKILSLFASILILIPLYVALHEGGHALTAVLCGARITQFRILGAYMAYEGGRFTSLTYSLPSRYLCSIFRECCCPFLYPFFTRWPTEAE